MRNIKLNPHKPHLHYSRGEWVCGKYKSYGFGVTPIDGYAGMEAALLLRLSTPDRAIKYLHKGNKTPN